MITEEDLYAMSMESETADRLMRELCERLGFQYPPQYQPATVKREALPDPLKEQA